MGNPRPGPSLLQKADHLKFIAKSSYTVQDLDLLCKEISCKTLSDTNKIDIIQQAVAPCPEIVMSIKGKPTRSGHSYSQKSWKIEAFSLCFILFKAPSGPPWNEGHWPKVRHETSVLESQFRNNTNTVLL